MERIFFNKFITKDLTATDSDRRLFEGILTVEMVDKQNEITVVNHLMKVLPIWMARGAPITDTHSNRVVGKGVNFAKTTVTDSEGTVYPAITIQGEIFKDYELDTEIWNAIKSGKYKGLSFGGATKADRTPIRNKDGSVSYALTDLEHYEVAVCEDPAVPLALITQSNQIAKSMAGNWSERGNGQMCIKCDRFGCHINKVNQDSVTGADNEEFEKATIPEPHPEGDEWSDTKQDITPLQDRQWRGEDSNKGNYTWGAPKQPSIEGDASRDEEIVVGKDDKEKEGGNSTSVSTTTTGVNNPTYDHSYERKKEHGSTFSGTGEEGNKPRTYETEQAEGLKDSKKEHLANTTVDGVRSGTGGYNTANQGPEQTSQVSYQERKPVKSKKKTAVINVDGKLFYIEE